MVENWNIVQAKNYGFSFSSTQAISVFTIVQGNDGESKYISSLVGCDVKPKMRYFLQTFPLCVTSTLTPLRAFLTCNH